MATVHKQRSANTRQRQQGFGYVREENDPYLAPFLALWPNRFDYIFASHPEPGKKPDWQTESRHPLGDRLIQQGAYLYGIRPK